jgi:hypothetical protein
MAYMQHAAVDDADVILQRMMVWAKTTHHDRTREVDGAPNTAAGPVTGSCSHQGTPLTHWAQVNWKAISANPWAQKVKTPEPVWGGGPKGWDDNGDIVDRPGARVGTPLFPGLESDRVQVTTIGPVAQHGAHIRRSYLTVQAESEFKTNRQSVRTPEPAKRDVVGNLERGETLYFVHQESGEIRMTWDMEQDISTDEEGRIG